MKYNTATEIIDIAPNPVNNIFVVLETSVNAPMNGEVNKRTRLEIVKPQPR